METCGLKKKKKSLAITTASAQRYSRCKRRMENEHCNLKRKKKSGAKSTIRQKICIAQIYSKRLLNISILKGMKVFEKLQRSFVA